MNEATIEMLEAMFSVMSHEELRDVSDLVWKARDPHMRLAEEEQARRQAEADAAAIEFANGLKPGDEVRLEWCRMSRREVPFFRGIVVKVNRVNVRLQNKWGEEIVDWPKTAITSV